ncbi:hypothetical protein [Stutzerimonas stutzeri]|uniref:hypothetical protein n=1 Tax=Stutzerimonas stutzeri TaxID=316 RepID=UPI000C9A2EC5|nr:hypothetical protein [Stutzerimonas stutzeri]PNG11866.1 hypothetical protein CXK97_19265 [Stutzerimonas stutzeri]
MLNASPLNAVPLNGVASSAIEPVYVVTGQSDVWRLLVRVADVDVSAQLTGTVEVDREEGAAGVGGFDLYIDAGPVVPTDWKGGPVTVDFICTTSGVTRQERRYTGQIAQANWDPVSRVLSCELSDQVQQRVESLSIAGVDSLVGGDWSADVFEAVEGRSHWDYALERLSTRTASLDCSPAGDLRVTSWYATAPHFVFGPGTTLYQSVELQQADLDRTTNRVEIEFSYRYSRLWQRNKNYQWQSPETQGLTGIGGFCQWRTNSHELPTKDMIADAASGNGETVINPSYYSLPLTMSDPCGDGNPWINTFDDLLLGVSWVGARRWVQVVTETYSLTLATTAGEAESSRIVQRAAYTVDVEDDQADEWVDEPILGGSSGNTDLPDDARRNAAMTVALRSAMAEIVSAHRETTLTFQVPTSLALGIDLTHTIELNDQGAHAIGKCRRIVDNFDLSSGQALTTLSIAVMRGGGVSDPLTLPPRLGGEAGGGGSGDDGFYVPLPTQLGGRLDSPPYDDTMEGFAGNYSSTTEGTEVFPRRMETEADEIPAEDRDERVLTSETLYRVGIPDNTLEL